MIAFKPLGMTDIEAAAVPVVAVTAWQMLSDYAHAERVRLSWLWVQLAARAGLHVIAVATKKETDYVRNLGARDASWRAA
jgi:NADPH:quinone reductase-like Zn-dependent oxidoreductase